VLARLVARDFRNFAQLDIAMPGAGLAIIGENGHGKTNLLEAVAYLSLLRSLRGARDADVVRFGAPAFHIRAELVRAAPSGQRESRDGQAQERMPERGTEQVQCDGIAVGYERASKRKRATLDGVEQPRLTSALGALPSVCFSPADVSLVAGGPGERRRFLDVALALSSRSYLLALQQYRAALLRRNAALRAVQREGGRPHAASIDKVSVWEPALALHGGVVASLRQSFVQRHAQQFADIGTAIGERAVVSMRYVPSSGATADSAPKEGSAPAADVSGEEQRANAEQQARALSAAFALQRAQELRRGMTLVGPHRDELQLLLGGRELRTFGSAGQQRSAAIALRLLELATLRDAIGATPLLLLDDPFAELDAGRAARVLALLEASGVGQVLLAVPRLEDIPAAFTRLERRTMRDGTLT
jgi:DNA replication and repair protein RecF